MTDHEQEVPVHTRMLRLVNIENKSVPPGVERPQIADFLPSQKDKEEAVDRGFATPRLSMFDRAMTCPSQAKTFLETPVEFLKGYSSILQAMKDGAANIRVLRDPLLDDPRPGHEGHCLVEGFSRPAGMSRKDSSAAILRAIKNFTLDDDDIPMIA